MGLDDHTLAHDCALAAGRTLMDLRRSGAPELGEAGDAAAQDVLHRLLRWARPDDAVLSEEAADDPRRLTADRVWIVDPLDGTREYAEPPRTDWAVHVALWERGALTAGAVALPARGTVLSTSDGAERPVVTRARPRLVVSRTRPPEFVAELAERLDADVVEMGSAGAKAAAVVRGHADLYVHAGGQYEWDSAAPVAVALRHGVHASRLDGGPLLYNQPDPRLPDLVICAAPLAARVLAAIAAVTQQPFNENKETHT